MDFKNEIYEAILHGVVKFNNLKKAFNLKAKELDSYLYELIKEEKIIYDNVYNSYFALKEAILDVKQLKYLEVKKEVETIRNELAKLKAKIDLKTALIQKKLKDIQKITMDYEEQESIVLVHRTATVKQLKQYQKRKMIVTEIDASYQYKIGVADEVFCEDVHLIDLPYYMVGRDLTFEEKSAIAFANMIFYYELNHFDYKAIYSDELISKLLRFNGFYS